MRDLRPTTIEPDLNEGKSFKSSDVIVGTKRFDETIVEEFSIIAFKSWEDLQDHELNERAIKDAINIDATNVKETSKKSNSQRSRGKRSSTKKSNSNDHVETDGSTTIGKTKVQHESKKVAIKSEKGSKDKRNKISSEKITIEEALKAKELAEKRLSILQEELEKEQCRNLKHENNIHEHNIPRDNHPQVNSCKEESKSVKVQPTFSHNLIKNSSPPYKPVPYSTNQPSHISVNNDQVRQTYAPPFRASPSSLHDQTRAPQQQNFKQSSPYHQYEQSSFNPHQIHQSYIQQYHNQLAQPPQPPPYTHLMHQHQQQHNHQLHLQPYTPQPLSAMSNLPTPFGFPSPVCITDTTFSRQTSIVPALSSAPMDQPLASAGGKITESNLSHPISPYNHAMPMHQSMYYPYSLPAERSFIQFTRSYTGPGGHMGYHSNLMGSLPPTHTSSQVTTNQYPLDPWPRGAAAGLIHPQTYPGLQSNLGPSTTTLPGRSFAGYTSTRLP